jgi:hypothetical protein
MLPGLLSTFPGSGPAGASGTIWLYSYSRYGLQRIELVTIQNGPALAPLDTGRLKREPDPHPNTDGYVIVLQIGEHLRYRTAQYARKGWALRAMQFKFVVNTREKALQRWKSFGLRSSARRPYRGKAGRTMLYFFVVD